MKALEIAYHCADAAEDKKAKDIVILDMRELTSVADYFMICAGLTERQTRAIADEILQRLRKKGIFCTHLDGEREGRWIVIDFVDVLVHIFSQETREFYQLERLWGDAEKILHGELEAPAKAKPKKKKNESKA